MCLCALPAPAAAHDAFGDLGPFYASFLHPAADPLQAALILGAAAYLAGRPLAAVRFALPVFLLAAAAGHVALYWSAGVAAAPLAGAVAAIVVGLAAILPDRWTPRGTGLILMAATGAIVGIAPGRPPQGLEALQPILGTVLGIGVFVTILWISLESLARRVSPVVPAIAGSWVAAVGLLAAAFAI